MITCSFTVDIDNDSATISNERNELTWAAVEEVPRIAAAFRRCGVGATWFVRADNQLDAVYGHPDWLLQRNRPTWDTLRAEGHGIGWHPHIVREDNGSFIAETDDTRCAAALRRVFESLSDHHWRFTAVRIGEAFHGNQSMNALDALGLQVDSTALPGRLRADEARRFDWTTTPNRPYRPSVSDYRIPGNEPLSIVEVPMTTMPVKAPYDPGPLLRYLNLAYRHSIFRDALGRHFETLDHTDHTVVTILHPDEVRAQPDHPLYAFDVATVERNLDYLLGAAGAHGGVRVASLETIAAEAASGEAS